MNSREYEQHQLALIAQDYRRRGFRVELESQIPEAPKWRFDALAVNEAGETVIIELVNRRLNEGAAEERLMALGAVAAIRPDVKVDFRYIDVDTGAVWIARNRSHDDAVLDFPRVLGTRLPSIPNGANDVTKKFLALWPLHVSLIRQYCRHLGLANTHTEDVLDLYNELLRAQRLVAPENVVDEVTLDLFDLYAVARGALQGASVDRAAFQQLRMHTMSVKQQARNDLAARAPRKA